MASSDSILDFWFGSNPDDMQAAQAQAGLWWSKKEEIDAAIRTRFQGEVEQARHGALDSWRATARGALALILLADQFPRNIYRDSPQAFGSDPLAREICLQGLEQGLDRQLRPVQRVFFYLPLEHAETLSLQEHSVSLFRTLWQEVPEAWKPTFQGFLDYAIRHKDIIERFGRFPHRNIVLGRPSTAAELRFLQEPGSSF